MATPAQRQALPAKEQALFRTVVRHYEAKQYKKGLKAADQLLKCAPARPRPRARAAPPPHPRDHQELGVVGGEGGGGVLWSAGRHPCPPDCTLSLS